MALWQWLSNRTRYKHFRQLNDAFAVDRPTMFEGLRKSIETQQDRCHKIWVVAHFRKTYFAIQEYFGRESIEYEIVEAPIVGLSRENTRVAETGAAVRLVLASLIESRDQSSTGMARPTDKLAIMVCERHPQVAEDQRLLAVARAMTAQVTMGYLLSLDDFVVQQVVSPTTLTVLKQLGLDGHELITSHHLSRQLERRLTRDAPKYAQHCPADSASDWVALNNLSSE